VGRGQEAISVGSTILTKPEDVVCRSHRDLGALLIRFVEPWIIMAQYLGRRDGPTRGRDGNTHVGCLQQNVLSYISNMVGIVPVANGAAPAFKYRVQPNVVLCYFGDGATSRGEWHEAPNFGGVFKLLIVHVCNNDQYAFSTHISRQMAVHHIADRGSAYGMPVSSSTWESVRPGIQTPVPPVRITAPDCPVPYSPPLEKAFLPNVDNVLDAVRRLVA